MRCSVNKTGCSQAGVYRFFSEEKSYFLKTEKKPGELELEYQNLSWLKGRLPVPEVIEWHSGNEYDYLLMTEISGCMLCEGAYLKGPELTVSVMAKGLKLLQSIDIRDCPLKNGLGIKLRDAAENIRLDRVDTDDWEEDNTRFETPEELLDYLTANKPEHEDLVFSHGDYCPANIFGNGAEVSGFIDTGRAGIADRWQDIALCLRSLWHTFGTDKYDSMLLEQIGVKPDKAKLDYYILLDELF